MGVLLLAVNAVFAGSAALVLRHWRRARRAVPTVDRRGAVAIRIRRRPADEDQVDRWVRRALAAAALVPAGPGAWGDRDGAAARVLPPVVGDRTTLIEVSATEADAVLAALVTTVVDEGWSVRRRRGSTVDLRDGPDRVRLEVAPA